MPKKETLKTPTTLPKWFAKLLQKRYGVKGNHFTYSDTVTDFKLVSSKTDLRPFVSECVVYPVFQDDISAEIEASKRIPSFLKLEIRSFLEKHYSTPL